MNTNMPKPSTLCDSKHPTRRSRSYVQLPVGDLFSASPAPVFHYSTSDFIYDLRQAPQSSTELKTGAHKSLNDLLRSRWEDAKKDKVFNYDLNCMYKFLDGEYNLNIQLNEERGRLRRKPMRFHHVREPFNQLRWNFTKLNPNEILLYLRCCDNPCSSDPLDQFALAVNASPLEIGHSLILPALNRCIPQLLNEMALRVAVHVMLLVNDDSFHVLYNSLLGQASVNHLHFHALFWPYDSDLINRKCDVFKDGIYVIRRPTWFINTIVFQLQSNDEIDNFMSDVTQTVDFLNEHGIAHNLFFSRAQPIRTTGELYSEDREGRLPQLVTLYLFPRTSVTGAKPAAGFNPAAIELAGCLSAHTLRFFDSATEENVIRIINEEATLPDRTFEHILRDLSAVMEVEGRFNKSIRRISGTFELSSRELDELRDSFQTFDSNPPRSRTGRADSVGSAVKVQTNSTH